MYAYTVYIVYEVQVQVDILFWYFIVNNIGFEYKEKLSIEKLKIKNGSFLYFIFIIFNQNEMVLRFGIDF